MWATASIMGSGPQHVIRQGSSASASNGASSSVTRPRWPRDPSSVLSRNLGFGGSQSPEEAARTPVMLARGELGADLTGRYFEHGREANCRFAADREAVERLYAVCGGYG